MRNLLRILVLILFGSAAQIQAAESLLIAAGAGYKGPLLELYAAFERETGIEVRAAFGNMRQVLAQTRDGGQVDLVVGERGFLAESGLFARDVALGQGRLMLVYAEGIEARELDDPAIQRIALPDPDKAIYGRAAYQALERSGQLDALRPRLTILSTVPQVAAHLRAGSVEAGFINGTQAQSLDATPMHIEDVDPALYDAPQIVIGIPQDHTLNASTQAFLDFIATERARDLLKGYGL